MNKINVAEKLSLFSDYWNPRILAELNGQEVKAVKFKGEFKWHHHENEDELFFVIKGQLKMNFRDKVELINPGEFIVVPRMIEHNPEAVEECEILLFEPKATINTGNLEKNELTREKLEKI